MNLVERLRNPASRKSWMLVDEQADEAADYIEKLESQMKKDLLEYLAVLNEIVELQSQIGLLKLGEINE